MISGGEIADHLWALLVVGTAVVAAGIALARFLPKALRAQAAAATWPLLGGAYWAIALYLLPFRGGWLVAAVVAVVGAAMNLPTGFGLRSCRSLGLHGVVLLVGCLPYTTPIFTQHVPQGMDGSRYLLGARVIAARAGLPATLAPVMPDVPFGATNHGVPAIAAVAIRAGASAPAALLATIPLTFAALILSLYVLLRLVARRGVAAVVAVATVWLAHQVQQTLGWGGFPGIFALALGFLAARLLMDVLRGSGGGWALGACAGALPLVHVGAATAWLHILAPVAVVVGLLVSRQRLRGLRSGLIALVVALAIVWVYYLVGRPQLAPGAAEVFRRDAVDAVFPDSGPALVLAIVRYLVRGVGSTLSWLSAVALIALVWRRRWKVLAVVAGVLGLTFLILLNAKFARLPTSVLLFPERVRDLPLVATAVALAIAWRDCALVLRAKLAGRARPTCRVAALVLLTLAFTHHYRFFQRTAFRPEFTEAEWRGLCWAKVHLNPATDFVATIYGTSGAYLPGVAGIPVTRWHAHPADQLAAVERLAGTRRITHVWLIARDGVLSPIGKRDYERDAPTLEGLLRDQIAEEVFSAWPLRVCCVAAASS